MVSALQSMPVTQDEAPLSSSTPEELDTRGGRPMAQTTEWFSGDPRAMQFHWGNGRHLVISFVAPPTIGMSIFTRGERAVAKLVVAGLSNAEIARERGTSVRTVANQVASLLRKAKLESRHQLVLRLSKDPQR
jgi:DNA-binding NarL/FixJ family response regulator